MTTSPKRVPRILLRSIPMALTLAVLAGVACLGYRNGWTIGPAAQAFGASKEPKEDWCMDHGVPESSCIICRGLDVGRVTPTAQVSGHAVEPPATAAAVEEGAPRDGASSESAEPTTAAKSKKRPAVQLASAETASRSGIVTAPAVTQKMDEAIDANAEVVYDQTRYAQVSSRAAGAATMVRVHAGQRVRKGDVLAVIEAAEVGKAKAELLQAGAQVASRRVVVERMRRSTSEGFRNQADLVETEAQLKEASIRLFNARQALVNLGLSIPTPADGEIPSERDLLRLGLPKDVVAELGEERISANLLPVVAPLDGSVISRGVVSGEVVETGKPLFVIADTARMWVHAELSLAEAMRVKAGQRLEFTSDVPGAPAAVGEVVWVSPEVNPKTRTVQVRAEVPNADGALLAHAFGRARITLREVPGAVLVPEGALQRDGEVFLVFVKINDEVFETREVQLGGSARGIVEIRSGIRPGELVAVAGSYALVSQLNRGKLGAGCTDD